jgi:hypothetical protein
MRGTVKNGLGLSFPAAIAVGLRTAAGRLCTLSVAAMAPVVKMMISSIVMFKFWKTTRKRQNM